MKDIIKLTESDLMRIIKRVISEQPTTGGSRPTPVTQVNRPNTPVTGSSQKPTSVKANKVVSPQINIDCNRRVIVSSQLPKLDVNANTAIINFYCK